MRSRETFPGETTHHNEGLRRISGKEGTMAIVTLLANMRLHGLDLRIQVSIVTEPKKLCVS